MVDLLETWPTKLDSAELLTLLRQLPARAYSIASSPLAYPDEAHLLVALVDYATHGRARQGVASGHVAHRLAKGGSVGTYLRPNRHFRLPETGDTPIIMVGPGTGVAPFRAFVQHRREQGHKGRSWLFFGDRQFTHDFLYQLEWQEAVEEGSLTRMDVAFSRDQPEKVYVQHRLWERRADLWSWLQDGAVLYLVRRRHQHGQGRRRHAAQHRRRPGWSHRRQGRGLARGADPRAQVPQGRVLMADLSKNERIKAASNYLRGTLEEGLAAPITGAIAEDDTQLTKFHGLYLQDDRDLRPERRKKIMEPAFSFMARVRLPGGVCTPQQWLQMDRIATDYANHTLRLTTRQTWQFHGVIKQNLRRTMQAIDQACLDTIAACGDVNRNVMCNPNPHLSRAHAEALQLARAISTHLLPKTGAYREIWLEGEKVVGGEAEDEPIYGRTYLPRKFKTVIAVPPENDVDVFAQDLGLRRHPRPRRQRPGLERHRRRRHGHDPRRARHLPAHGRRDGVLHHGPGGRRGREGGPGPARLWRPHQPQARPAQIHDRGPRPPLVPRRGRAPPGLPPRRSPPHDLHPHRRLLRLARGRCRQLALHALHRERPHQGHPRAPDAHGPAQDRRDPQRRLPPDLEPEPDDRQRAGSATASRSTRS